MPRLNKTSSQKMENHESQEQLGTHGESSSEQEVTFHPSHVQQVIPSMFMPLH